MPLQGAGKQVQLDGKTYRVTGYTVDEVEILPQRIVQGTMRVGDRLDERDIMFDTWHLGYGLGEVRDDPDRARYHYSKGVDARFRGQMILGPLLSSTVFTAVGTAEAKVQFIEYNGSFYAIGARYVHVWNSVGETWDTSKDMGASAAAIAGCATVYGDYLVVAAGASVSYWRLFTDGVWDQPYATNKPSLFGSVGNTLYMLYSSNQLSSSTNFTTWTTAVTIGNSRFAGTMLTDYNGNPLVGKGEGLFEYDGTKVSNRLPELGFRLSATNCRGGKPSRGKLYLPVGPGLWVYTADAVQTEGKPTRTADVVAPGSSSRDAATEVRGTIQDLWPDVDFLWATFAAASLNYYILAYDYNPNAGQGWHQVTMTGTTSLTALGRFLPATGNPRIFYSEGTTIKYFLLPLNALNPYADTAYRYAASGDIFLPVEADGFDSVNKAYLSLRMDVDGASGSNIYVDVSYTLDGGSEVSLGRITAAGVTTLFFPSTSTGRRISIHLKFATNDNTITPRVLPFIRAYQLRFDRKRRWKMHVLATRDVAPNVTRQSLAQLKNVESARDSVSPVTFIDLDNRTWTVFVKSIGEAEPMNTGTQISEMVKTIAVELIEWRSGVGINRWNDSTTVYDDKARWSTGSDANTAYWS